MTAPAPNGLLIVDKPRGPTSHDIVAQARRFFRTKAVGHAGTLDPMASGVLVLLLGEATKLSPYLTLDDKEYRATVSFGQSTDTLDAEGAVVSEREIAPEELSDAALARALSIEGARTEQVPPAFSAISVDGKRAHRLARKGEAPVLAPRPVTVKSVVLVSRDAASAVFELSVSKGYYVRSFARDVGESLGVPAHLSRLERTRSGPYRIAEAVPWPPPESGAEGAFVPLTDAACRVLPAACLTAEGEARAMVGKRLEAEHFLTEPPSPGAHGFAAWVSMRGVLVAVGEPDPEGGYRVSRGFNASGGS